MNDLKHIYYSAEGEEEEQLVEAYGNYSSVSLRGFGGMQLKIEMSLLLYTYLEFIQSKT
jgi:hypothetical protein